MSLTEFVEKVTRKARESGFLGEVKSREDDGKYIARVGDVVFIGNSRSESILLCWGCKHTAIARL